MAETEVRARARELRWLRLESSDVAEEVRLLSGYCRDSRHGGSDGGAGQPRARRRRQWELQGTLGGGEYEVSFWLNPPSPPPPPPPGLYRAILSSRRAILCLFAIPSEFGHFGFPAVPKKCEINYTKNYYYEFNYRY